MKIGTLSAACSFQGQEDSKYSKNKTGDRKVIGLRILPSPAKRLDAIESVLTNSKCIPDILVTSGSFIEDDAGLSKLEGRIGKLDWQGLLIVEVRNSNRLPQTVDVDGKSFQLMQHCLYALTRQTGSKALGRQCFASSTDVRRNLPALERNIGRREVVFRGRTVGALICGEINVLRVTKANGCLKSLSSIVFDHMKGWNIVVNPTHDRMGREFILSAKRSFLSKVSGSSGVYVSVSNWNIGKNQTRTAKTLHTVYAGGKLLEMESPLYGQLGDFEYRQATI